MLPQILATDDFVRFKVSTLNGPKIANKGFALFPRRIRGAYAMLSRQDGENLHVMESDMLHFWHARRLVLTHGVGPMRKYAIGAGLLVIPSSMSDYATTFATVPLADVLAAMEP